MTGTGSSDDRTSVDNYSRCCFCVIVSRFGLKQFDLTNLLTRLSDYLLLTEIRVENENTPDDRCARLLSRSITGIAKGSFFGCHVVLPSPVDTSVSEDAVFSVSDPGTSCQNCPATVR